MTATRNNIIVSNLDKLKYIENYETGVRRIFEDYADFYKKPLYEITDNSVILTLYNKDYYSNDPKDVPKNVSKDVPNNIPNRLSASERQDTIVEYIKDFPEITIAKLSQNLNVSEKTIKRDIEKLKNEKIICRSGSSSNGS